MKGGKKSRGDGWVNYRTKNNYRSEPKKKKKKKTSKSNQVQSLDQKIQEHIDYFFTYLL